MTPIRVLLADDHTLVRAGIRGLLQGLPGVEVVGEAGDPLQAREAIKALTPDVITLDVPSIRVIILSMHTSEEYVLRALRAGCVGYLLKASAVAELEVAVRAVARGETYLSPAVSKRVVDDYVSRTGGAADPLDALTPRQREILQLAAEGHSSKEIAQRLGLSPRTVEAHRAQLMERLGVHDLAGLVRFAVRVGLVGPEG